jgi:hypothetical protein
LVSVSPPRRKRENMRLKKRRPLHQQGPYKTKNLTQPFYHKNRSQSRFKSKRPKKTKPIALPDPLSFYQEEFPEIETNGEWVKVHCCFHDENKPSLSLNVESGGFHCFSCEASGGNIVAFVMKSRGISYKDALCVLGVTQ